MNNFTLEISGNFALFTRPEFKVERMSYEVITPSAARAIFEAIYWKPQMMWKITEIQVLKPIAFAHFKRCETAAAASTRKTEIVAERCRQIRSSVVLRDVQYRIKAQLVVNDKWLMVNEKSSANEFIAGELARHCATFRRRARKGQCFTQPYLGCREFAASWRLIENEYLKSNDKSLMMNDKSLVSNDKCLMSNDKCLMMNEPSPIAETRELGTMLYDIDYSDPKHPKPILFKPQMINGVIMINH